MKVDIDPGGLFRVVLSQTFLSGLFFFFFVHTVAFEKMKVLVNAV